jgi:hypothetical protein
MHCTALHQCLWDQILKKLAGPKEVRLVHSVLGKCVWLYHVFYLHLLHSLIEALFPIIPLIQIIDKTEISLYYSV